MTDHYLANVYGCDCDWCQWDIELTYAPGGGTLAALLLRMALNEATGRKG